jgi:hypothetical protein
MLGENRWRIRGKFSDRVTIFNFPLRFSSRKNSSMKDLFEFSMKFLQSKETPKLHSFLGGDDRGI